MVVAFPAVGLGLLWKAVVMTREYRHYGTVELVMDPYPAAIGGQMGGTILVPRLGVEELAAPDAEVTVTLECIYTYVSGSGKNRTRQERILWAERGKPKIETAGQGVRFAFRFDLPGDLPEADIEQSSRYHFWRLSVKADIEGVDLERQYDIPAFHGDARSQSVEHDISAQARDLRNEKSQGSDRRRRCRFVPALQPPDRPYRPAGNSYLEKLALPACSHPQADNGRGWAPDHQAHRGICQEDGFIVWPSCEF